MDALSPNTSAFLNYLSSQMETNNNNNLNDPNIFNNSNNNNNNTINSFGNINNQKQNPISLPPSAFFNLPVPGRDTPELTPESSSNGTSVSPPTRNVTMEVSDSSDEDEKITSRRKSSGGANGIMHKRKAGHGHTLEEEHDDDDDDDSGSDDPAGHEDKRAHPNDKAHGAGTGSGRKGRKSIEEGGGKGGKDSKAARRKEQNRAAQKAFRERREAKVKDLEDQIQALQNKSMGEAQENENLRSILKRLQEENMALKSSAFTFTMPMSSNGTPDSGTPSRVNTAAQKSTKESNKAPTPPIADPPLRSINESPALNSSTNLKHRNSSLSTGGALADSPESLVSINSNSSSSTSNGIQTTAQHPTFDPAEMFNAFAAGVRPEWAQTLEKNKAITAQMLAQKQNGNNNQQQQQQQQKPQQGRDSISPPAPGQVNNNDGFSYFSTSSSSLSPASRGSNNKTEIDALWASVYPNGVGAADGQTKQNNMNGVVNTQNGTAAYLPQQQNQVGGQANGQINVFDAPNLYNMFSSSNGIDKMAYRGNSDSSNTMTATAPGQNTTTSDPWSALNDESINEFLSSLNGNNLDNNNNNQNNNSFDNSVAEDDFNIQLQKLLNASTGIGNINSPSSAFISPQDQLLLNGIGGGNGGSGTGFSPTNYLNMSPSPLNSISNSQSPETDRRESSSLENSASPESSIGSAHSNPSTAATSFAAMEPSNSNVEQVKMAGVEVGANCPAGNVVHVVGEDGKVLKPSDLWVRMGMQHSNTVDSLMIDDLCDQMKAKATCKDGQLHLGISDAEHMFKYKGQLQSKYSKLTDDKTAKNIPFMENYLGSQAVQDTEFIQSLRAAGKYDRYMATLNGFQQGGNNQVNGNASAVTGNNGNNGSASQNGQNQNETKNYLKGSTFYDQMTMAYGI